MMEAEKEKILIVDDDISIIRNFEDLLKLTGYPVTTASNGEEALNQLGEDRQELRSFSYKNSSPAPFGVIGFKQNLIAICLLSTGKAQIVSKH